MVVPKEPLLSNLEDAQTKMVEVKYGAAFMFLAVAVFSVILFFTYVVSGCRFVQPAE